MKFRASAPRMKMGSFKSSAVKASDLMGSSKRSGLPNLALNSLKVSKKPLFKKFKHGLGALTSSIDEPQKPVPPEVPQPKPPEIKPNAQPKSASMLELKAQQSKAQSENIKDKQAPEAKDMITTASNLAAGFSDAMEKVKLSEEQGDTLIDIASKIAKYVEIIEEKVEDEQDTSIVHARSGNATSILHEAFMPTEVPTPKDDAVFGSMMSITGWLAPALALGMGFMAGWMGSLWEDYSTKLMSSVKDILALGWSRLVDGFDACTEWVSDSIGKVTQWVDNSVAQVNSWIQEAASKITELWNGFDFSALDITSFDLSGLWAKMTDLSVFGEWGNALKTALGIFGGSGLDSLKTVFDIATKVWDCVKPILKILGKVAKFLGPIGWLFGLATMADDIVALAGDVAGIIGAKTSEERSIRLDSVIQRMGRILLESVLPESWADTLLGSTREQEESIKEARLSGAMETSGGVFGYGSELKIKDRDKLNSLTAEQLDNIILSGKVKDEADLAFLNELYQKKLNSEDTTNAEVVQEEAQTLSLNDDVPVITDTGSALEPVKPEIDVRAAEVVKEIEAKNVDNSMSEIQIVNQATNQLKNEYPEYREQISQTQTKINNAYTNKTNIDNIKVTEADTINQTIVQPQTVTSDVVSSTVLQPDIQPMTVNVADAQTTSLNETAALAADTKDANLDPASKVDSKAEESDLDVSDGKGTQRAAKAAEYATMHAERKSTGYCARYVANGLQAVGYKFPRQAHASHYVTHGTLAKMGFEQVNNNEPPLPGDISVMGPRYNGHAGHISIFNGRNWVSDFVQRRESPYAQKYPNQWMTRWRDTGKGPRSDVFIDPMYTDSSNYSNGAVVSAESMNFAGISSEMSSIINTLIDSSGLKPLPVNTAPPLQQQVHIGNDTKKDTDLQLDNMLSISNGFN